MVDAEAWDHGVAFLPNPVHQSVFVACGFSVNSAVFANGFPVAFHRERAGVRSQAEPLSAHTYGTPRKALPVAVGTATVLTLVATVLVYRFTKRHPQLHRRNWQNKIRTCM